MENKCDDKLDFHGLQWNCLLEKGHEGKHRNNITTWEEIGEDLTIYQYENAVAGRSRATYPALNYE